jgi:hypothetical protein
LASERLRRGRGFSRAKDRPLWPAAVDRLPPGTVVVVDGEPALLGGETLQPFTFAGWADPVARPDGAVDVLTPPTSVAALAGGFVPMLHPTARA